MITPRIIKLYNKVRESNHMPMYLVLNKTDESELMQQRCYSNIITSLGTQVVRKFLGMDIILSYGGFKPEDQVGIVDEEGSLYLHSPDTKWKQKGLSRNGWNSCET